MAGVPGMMRPLSVGDIVDEAIRLYRRHFRLYLTLCAAVVVPVAVVELLLVVATDASADPVVTVVSTLLDLLAAVLVYVVLIAVLVVAASETWLGHDITAQEAFDRAWERVGSVAGLLLLSGAALLGLSVTIIGFPFAVFFGVAWLLAFPVVVLERTGIRRALGRSRALVRGAWWRVLGIFILVLVIRGVIQTFFTMPSAIFGASAFWLDPSGDVPLAASILSTLGQAAGELVTAPILYCSWTLLYYDQRIRKEGLDIELAVQQMERELELARPDVQAGR